jgi:hypothetical protein
MNEWDLLRGFSKTMLLIGLASACPAPMSGTATVIGIGYLAGYIMTIIQ